MCFIFVVIQAYKNSLITKFSQFTVFINCLSTVWLPWTKIFDPRLGAIWHCSQLGFTLQFDSYLPHSDNSIFSTCENGFAISSKPRHVLAGMSWQHVRLHLTEFSHMKVDIYTSTNKSCKQKLQFIIEQRMHAKHTVNPDICTWGADKTFWS